MLEVFCGAVETADDFLDDIGDTELVFLRLLFLCKTTRSGEGSNTISATLGDSVSL